MNTDKWITHKVIYDKKHEYYKLQLYQQIPITYQQHITIKDLYLDYIIYYDDIPYNTIEQHLHSYWLNGTEALKDLNKDEKKSFIQFYNLPQTERQTYHQLIEQIRQKIRRKDLHKTNIKDLLRN